MESAILAGASSCKAKVTLAAGTTTTISNTGAIPFSIDGKAYSRAAMTNVATPTTDAATGAAFPALTANKGTVVIVGLNAAGSVVACQGQIKDLDVSGNFITAPELPTLPRTMCQIGYIILKAGATLAGTFTFGTNNLSGVTGMTYTFGDLMEMPSRPITA